MGIFTKKRIMMVNPAWTWWVQHLKREGSLGVVSPTSEKNYDGESSMAVMGSTSEKLEKEVLVTNFGF
jgi:hypothetical protein